MCAHSAAAVAKKCGKTSFAKIIETFVTPKVTGDDSLVTSFLQILLREDLTNFEICR